MLLELGLATVGVMFSIIDGMLIKGLPFDGAPRIAAVQYLDPMRGGEEPPFPLGDFVRDVVSSVTSGARRARRTTCDGGF